MTKKKMAGRPRGGASHPCPQCGGATSVIDTRRSPRGAAVTRIRQCADARCAHRYATHERRAPGAQP